MVKEAIINALSPVSIAYEDTWKMLSKNVEHCVAKVHRDFARAMHEERQRNQKLSSDLAYVKEETEAIRKAMDIMLRDNGNLKEALTKARGVIAKNEEELCDLRAEKDSLAMELNIVRRANEQTVEELGKRKGEMEAVDYVDSFVGSMRSEFAKQMDLNLTSLFKELHEQKTLRVQAEKRLEDAMGKMKAIADSVTNPQPSSPCHSRDGSTVIGTPAPGDLAKREYPSSSVTSPIILAPHFLVPSRPSSRSSLSRPSSRASVNPPPLPASPISPDRRSARIQPHHPGEPPLPTPPPSSGLKRSRAEYEAEEVGSVVDDEGAKRGATRKRSGSVSTAVVDPVQPPSPEPFSFFVKMEDGEVDELKEAAAGEDGEVRSGEEEVKIVEEEVVMADVKVEECNLKTSGSTSQTSPPAAPIKRKLLGINHIPLLFHVEPERLRCRMCLTLDPLAAKKGAGCFPRNSQWPALFDHCMREHPKACEDMERLTPAQIAEMRARMSMGKS